MQGDQELEAVLDFERHSVTAADPPCLQWRAAVAPASRASAS